MGRATETIKNVRVDPRMRQKCNAGHTDLLSGVFPHTNTSLAAGVRIAGVRSEIPKEQYKRSTPDLGGFGGCSMGSIR